MNLYFDSIKSKLSSTSRWRRKMALKFPDDARNSQAAEQLERLSESPWPVVDATIWDKVRPFVTGPSFQDALSESTKAVGFRNHPATVNDYLASLAECAALYADKTGGAQ
jgi:hypothetical protein